VLAGYPFRDTETKEAFVVIVGVVQDLSDNRSLTHFTVTPETSAKTREVMEKDYHKLIAVGWYHSHPGHGVFLSAQDMTIVQGVYDQPWNIAWVIDPVRNTEGIFYGADGKPIIPNAKEHALYDKNDRIWIMLSEIPQCINE